MKTKSLYIVSIELENKKVLYFKNKKNVLFNNFTYLF